MNSNNGGLSVDGAVVLSCILQFFLVWVVSSSVFIYVNGEVGDFVTIRAIILLVVGLIGSWFVGQRYATIFMIAAAKTNENWPDEIKSMIPLILMAVLALFTASLSWVSYKVIF